VIAGTMWDPDGAGPATPVLVIGGQFTVAGSALADNNISGVDELFAEYFYAETLCITIPDVSGTTGRFFMGHLTFA